MSQVANTHLHTEATGVSNFKLSKVARTVCVCDTPSHCLRESHAVVSAVDSCIDTRQFNIDANFEAPTRRWHQQAQQGTKSAIKSAFKGSSPQAQAAAAAALNVPRGGAQRTNCPQMSSSRALGLSVEEKRGEGGEGFERGTQCATIDCSRVCVCAPVVACLRNVTKVKTSIRIQSAAGHAGYVVCPSRRCCRGCPCVVVLVVAPQVSSKVKPIKRHTPTPPRTLHPTHARILAMLLCA